MKLKSTRRHERPSHVTSVNHKPQKIAIPQLVLATGRNGTLNVAIAKGSFRGKPVTLVGKKQRFAPYSWPALVTIFAQMASAYLDDQKLAALFDNQIDQIRDMIHQAGVRIVTLLSIKMEEVADDNTRRECQAAIDTCVLELREFENNPRPASLDDALSSSSRALDRIAHFKVRFYEFEAYGDAVSIRVLALCVAVKSATLENRNGAKKNVRDFVTEVTSVMGRMVHEARAYYQGLLDGVSPLEVKEFRQRHSCAGVRGDRECRYWVSCKVFFYDNGTEHCRDNVSGATDHEAANNARALLRAERDPIILRRTSDRDRIVAEMETSLALRLAAWRECILKAR